MRQQLIYDLPTRLFHWIFSGLFLSAFIITKTVDDDSPLYSYHMLIGLTLSFLVILRIIWGFVGTKHARFSNFSLNPMDIVRYFKGILSGEKRRWPGHNPASSWAAILMMAMALGLGITGYLMTSGSNKETFEDIHELLSDGFIIIVGLHIIGVVLHTLRYKDNLGMSMVDGKKADIPSVETISSPRNVIGIFLIGFVVAFALHLYKNYDVQTQTLQFFGTTLQLGENEGDEGGDEGSEGSKKESGESNGSDKDDDDD